MNSHHYVSQWCCRMCGSLQATGVSIGWVSKLLLALGFFILTFITPVGAVEGDIVVGVMSVPPVIEDVTCSLDYDYEYRCCEGQQLCIIGYEVRENNTLADLDTVKISVFQDPGDRTIASSGYEFIWTQSDSTVTDFVSLGSGGMVDSIVPTLQDMGRGEYPFALTFHADDGQISLWEDAGWWVEVVVTDDGGNQAVCLERLCDISGDSCEIYDVSVTCVRARSAKISWRATSDAVGCILYDTEEHDCVDDYSHTSYNLICTPDKKNVVWITCLIPATEYHFRVYAESVSGAKAVTDDQVFTTSDGGGCGWCWCWMWQWGKDD